MTIPKDQAKSKLPRGWFEIKRLNEDNEELRTAISAQTVLYVSEVIRTNKKKVLVYTAEDRSYSTYETYEDVIAKIARAKEGLRCPTYL